jgi:2-(1,2-epoxy-1,2-dihydrophenyl)acetyl-CoA isomerase
MGLDRALKMTLLSEIYDAATAERLGLVTEVVDDDALEGRALQLCEALATKAPLAVRLSKMMMAKAMETTLESSIVDAQMAVMISNPSADVREGIAAFREKRAPKFEGR